MARATDNLLILLRRLVQERGTNVAALAEKTGIARARLKRVLTGSEPMLVDELVSVSTALDIQPNELGMADLGHLAEGDLPEPLSSSSAAQATRSGPEGQVIDPFGNHTEQLFRIGFALGCDFAFVARTDALDGSGVPRAALLKSPSGKLVFTLDARFHADNDPRYDEGGITLTLSFDRLIDCRFPYESVVQVSFSPVAPPPPEPASDPDESSDDRPGVPHLRLVT